jgi:V8-like Glu-specific endopeptidase
MEITRLAHVRYHLGMTVQRTREPDDSRLGELGEQTRALLDVLARKATAHRTASDEYVPERTLRDQDFLPAWFLRVGFERARSIARIELSDGSQTWFGTGFMVSPGLLMTNHHVLPSLEVARKARVFFDYEDDEQGRQLSPQLFLAQPDRYFLNNELLDVAIVAVDGEPGRRWGTIPLRHRPSAIGAGARVNLIQHPRGGSKQIVMHGNEVVAVSDAAIHYLADTEGGSSGSPVFNDRWELVALHHRGGSRDNVGVRMDQVLKFLTVAGSERGASPMLRELLDGVLDSGDFGLFATAGLHVPAPTVAHAPESTVAPRERVVLDWMGGAEFLDPGYWDLSPLFAGMADEGEGVQPRILAVAGAVELAGTDFIVLEGIPSALRARLAEALEQRGQSVELLGEHALLSLDPAVSVVTLDLEGDAAVVAGSTCNGRRVLPAGFVKLQLALARPGTESARALYLLFVEIDPVRDLPSRAHRNELARVLGALALACGRDVVIVGALASVLDRPSLREIVAPPELTILACPTQPGNADVGAIAWVGDGHGADLERVYCWPEIRTVFLDAKVERHDYERRIELAPELSAAGSPLLMRAGFGEIERPLVPVPERSAGPREIAIGAHVKSIVIVE